MRTLIQPPPSSHCDLCGGELRLKKVESDTRELDWEDEVLVCVNCGHSYRAQWPITTLHHTPRWPS